MGLLSSAATVFLLCACGTGLTLYAVHVQRSRQDDSGYRALCDVDDVITCSEIITDERDFVELVEWACQHVGVVYNWKLNPRQPALRIAFFPLLCFLGCLPLSLSYFTAAFISSAASLLSAYLLYMQNYIRDQICLPCVAEYFINILLFLVLAVRWVNFGSSSVKSTSTNKSSVKSSNSQQKEEKSGSSKQQETEDKSQGGGESSGDQGSGNSDSKHKVTDTATKKSKNPAVRRKWGGST